MTCAWSYTLATLDVFCPVKKSEEATRSNMAFNTRPPKGGEGRLPRIRSTDKYYTLNGCGMGTLFVLVSLWFRENVVVTCKIGSFLCSLDNLLQKNVFLFSKFVNYHIRNLWRIRRFITQDACHSAVRALVLSRIDYANSLLYNVRSVDLMRLQRLQNKVARLVFPCGRDERSVDLLTSLHWLPVKERILYKFILYTFKGMNNAAPSYFSWFSFVTE